MSVTAGDLRQVFQGPVHAPDDPGYHDLRVSLKLRVNPEPALVAEASHVADVQAALRWARDRGLPFALQATGHGTFVPSDGGLLVRIARLGGVLVDPDLRIAEVQAGARWGDVASAAAPFGLAPLSGSAHDVGVVGYTIGGGVGWIARRFGYAADSVLSAEVVTADGELVKANPDEHADLYWALRGGGSSFGVVTSLRFRLYPLERVYGGDMLFPIERAADTFAFYADWAEPAELTTAVVVQRDSPVESVPGPVLAVRGLYAGAAADGKRAFQPLLDVAGPPLFDGFTETTFAESSVGAPGPQNFELFDRLPEPVIDSVIDSVGDAGEAAAVEIRHWGGAMADSGNGAGPAGHRDVPFSVKVEGPAASIEPILPYATGKTFLNFMPDPTRTGDAFTESDFQRLQQVKRAYDPDNVFHLNQNIAPAS